jgi:hypothetical protein
MRSLQLTFNEDDDPGTVASAFIAAHGIGVDSLEEVRNFVLERKAARAREGGGVARRRRPAPPPPVVYTYFPTAAYITLDAVDLRKVAPKFAELNAAVGSSGEPGAALDAREADAVLTGVVGVLADTARWHSSTVPRDGVRALLKAVRRWPHERAFPALDVLRVLVCHPDGAEAVAEVGGPGFVAGEVSRIAALRSRSEKELRATTLLSARALFNAARHPPTRALLMAAAPSVLDAASDLLGAGHPPLRFAAGVLMYNVAHALRAAAARAGGGGAAASGGTPELVAGGLAASPPPPVHPALARVDPAVVEQLLGVCVETARLLAAPPSPTAAAAAAPGAGGEDDLALKLVAVLGTVVLLGHDAAASARGLGLGELLGELTAAGGRFAGVQVVRDAVAELRPLLVKR